MKLGIQNIPTQNNLKKRRVYTVQATVSPKRAPSKISWNVYRKILYACGFFKITSYIPGKPQMPTFSLLCFHFKIFLKMNFKNILY